MTERKLGRNDPCWCGSGKKHKRCHLDREYQRPLDFWDVSKTFSKRLAEKMCLVPNSWQNECEGKISRSHTVPRAGSLQLISRDGHVYSFIPRLESVRKYQSKVHPQLFGINQASTFTGFCSKHDNNTFKPLEDDTFAGTQEQCLLLGYRALAREIYLKKVLSSSDLNDIRRNLDKGKPFNQQIMMQATWRDYEIGLSAGLKDSQYHKQIYDRIIESRQFEGVRGYIIEFENPPPVMCSFAFLPEQDFDGSELQNLSDLSTAPDLLSVTSFHGGERGIVAFSWLADNDKTCRGFIESLQVIPNGLVTAALLRLFFSHSENIHMAPDWWEALPQWTRDTLQKRFTSSANLWEATPKAVLADDGMSLVPWAVTKRLEIAASKVSEN